VAELGGMMLQLGTVLLLAFLGATVASRLRVSVIIGYIVAGILIGPHIAIDLGGLSYRGLVDDTALITELSQIGLILLLFFVGLEFSVAKLRRVKEAAAILAVINLAVNLFVGFALGAWLGWPLVDTIFLAGVISMSSSAVTAKMLLELRRTGNAETEFLLGMVILESFMAMFLLTLVNGLVVRQGGPGTLTAVVLGAALFIGFFAFLAAVVIPRSAAAFARLKNDELFLLFSLGLVFLASALAESFGIPSVIGAFFLGMTFADMKVADRMRERMAPLRDAFVAVFFLSFGMMIDPSTFPLVAPMLVLAVPLIFLNDLLVTGALAYLLGFTGRAASAIGTSLLARNEEAVLYASVGTKAVQSNPAWSHEYAGSFLNPFTGLLCIVMSSLAPAAMKHADGIARFLRRLTPESLAFGGDLVKRTLRTFILPAAVPIYRRGLAIPAALVGFLAYAVALLVTTGPLHLALALPLPISVYAIWAVLRRALAEPVRHTNYGVEGGLASASIHRFVLLFVVGAFATIALVAALWSVYWPATLVVAIGYFAYVVLLMTAIHRRFRSPVAPPPPVWAVRGRNGR
jgi:CPA2 family monovalent cation:H+ antiporter-2